MSIKLPKYTIQESLKESPKYKIYLFPLILIVSIVIGVFLSRLYFSESLDLLSQRNEVLEEQNTENQDKIVQLSSELSILKAEKKVKNEALLQLQQQFKLSIDDHNQLKSEINFYERLLSPDVENKGLRVFESKIENISENTYSLNLTVVQKLEKAQVISGTYKIYINGKLNGKAKTITVNPNNDSFYNFKYYDRLSSNFSLPVGYNAEQLLVKLIPKNNKSKTVEYTENWNLLIK